MKRQHYPISSFASATEKGFSLIELIAVIGVIVMLCALTLGALGTVSDSYQLSTATQGVSSILNRARQLAMSQNAYVQVRLYEEKKPGDSRFPNYVAIATFLADSPYYGTESEYSTYMSQGKFKPEGPLYAMPQAVAILKSSENSKLLDEIAKDQLRIGKDTSGRMTGHSWVAFYFDPKGGIDVPDVNGVPLPADQCFMTVCLPKQYKDPQLPSNFAVLLFDPVNGRMQITRP